VHVVTSSRDHNAGPDSTEFNKVLWRGAQPRVKNWGRPSSLSPSFLRLLFLSRRAPVEAS